MGSTLLVGGVALGVAAIVNDNLPAKPSEEWGVFMLHHGITAAAILVIIFGLGMLWAEFRIHRQRRRH